MKKYMYLMFVIVSLILSGCGQVAQETSSTPPASTPSTHVMLTASLPAGVVTNSKVSVVDSDNNLITQTNVKEENGNKKIEVEVPNDKDIKLLDNYGQTLKEIVKGDLLSDLLVNLISWNKGVISGTVTLPAGSNANIQVKLLGTQFSAYTDEDGNYKIMYIPEGNYTLSIEKTNYTTVTQSITIEPLKNTTSNTTVMTIANCTVYLTPSDNEWIDTGLDVVAYTQYSIFSVTENFTKSFEVPNPFSPTPSIMTQPLSYRGLGQDGGILGDYEVVYKVGENETGKSFWDDTNSTNKLFSTSSGRLYMKVLSSIDPLSIIHNYNITVTGTIDIHLLH